MAMYECDECGEEHGTFPRVMLAINSLDRVYPYHNTIFENKFHEIFRPKVDVQTAWDRFYAWLGDNRLTGHDDDNHMKWFCSQNCAIRFLMKTMIEKGE